MLRIKRDVNQQDFKIFDLHFVIIIFPHLEVVDRGSETQIQRGGNCNQIIWR